MQLPVKPLRRSMLWAVLAWLVAGFALTQAQTSLPNARVGTSYSYQVSTSPAAAAGTVYGATGLPTGIAINSSSGLISGTPTTAGTNNGTISLTSGGITNSFNVVLVVDPPLGTPAITSATTSSGTVGTAFSTYTVTASNSPTSFNIGTLPAGLTQGGTATAPTIGGTPTTAGTYQVSLSANNATGNGAVTTLTITIAPAGPVPAITSATTAAAPLNTAFTYTITASNSPASFSASGLPLGLSLNSTTGAITGSPTVAGVYTVALRATNNNGTGAATNLTLTVGALPTISSASSLNLAVNQAMSPFTLTATNSPTSFNVTGLPAGLSVNSSTGVISGTPSAVGTSTVSLSANNSLGTGPATTLSLGVGAVPTITSAGVLSATVGQAITAFQLAASNSPTSFAANGLPSGLTINTTTGLISGTPTAAGTYSVSVSATNSFGSGPSSTLSVTVTTSGGSTVVAVAPPVITGQPASLTVSAGANASFTIFASGGAPLSYAWRKNGTVIAGANGATLTLTGVQAADAGTYDVVVSNITSAVSNTVTLTVNSPPALLVPPTIRAQPANQTAPIGSTVALSVSASGTPAPTYQWQKNGTNLPGATSATLTLTAVQPADAGAYTVVVTNSQGSVTSSAATVAVSATLYGGVYFGAFDANQGAWALYVRTDGTAAFVGHLTSSRSALYLTTNIATDGSFSVVGATAAPDLNRGSAFSTVERNGPPRAAAPFTLSGRISSGRVTGQLSGLGVALTGAADTATGPASSLAGLYAASQLGSDTGNTYVIVGASGQALVVTTTATLTDSATGTMSASGTLATLSAAGTSTTVAVNSESRALSVSLAPAGATAPVLFAGLADGTAATSRLINFSVRAITASGDQTLIVGFTVGGSGAKRTLIRGVGPTLAQFGVSNALADPLLRLFNSASVLVNQNDDWSGDAALSAAFNLTGAFSLANTSKDAALLPTLAAGGYTAQLNGLPPAPGGAVPPGVSLLEAYDAETGAPTARLTNLSARNQVGTGENVLIAGFAVAGNGPKTLLIRGIGPSLTQFGVGGALADPRLVIFNSRGEPVAQNNDWAGTTALSSAFGRAGAFGLAATSKDAATVVTLAPGAYTAQVASADGIATGVALVEIYELP